MRLTLKTLTLILATLWSTQSVEAFQVTPLDDGLVVVDLKSVGSTRADALRSAREQAVLGSAGRILLDGKLLRADELMTKYLKNYTDQFVVGVEVLSDRFEAGQSNIHSRIFVDYDALANDMTEKRFLHEPAFKTRFAVFLEETFLLEVGSDKETALDQEFARPLLANAFVLSGLSDYKGTITTPPTGVDVSTDGDLLKAALETAERRNVEIIMTGSAVTRLRKTEKLYYDNFSSFDCEMKVKLIRVDNGEVLAEVYAQGAASERDQSAAIRTAIERAAAKIANSGIEKYREIWPVVVQSKADYELLLTGVDDELIRIISQHLERLGGNTKIHLKTKFDRSALLTIKSEADRTLLLEAIRSCSYPALTIIKDDGNQKIEIQVAG